MGKGIGIGVAPPFTGGLETYLARVLATGPVALWPQYEAAGSTAACLVSALQNGTYTGVTLGETGIGDGNTVPLYDGANDYLYTHSASFEAAFDGAEGSILIWLKPDSGAWTDSTVRFGIRIRADNDNQIYIQKGSANNQLLYYYIAGATVRARALNSQTFSDFEAAVLTWSVTADEVHAYISGTEPEVSVSGLGTWAGSLDGDRSLVGAAYSSPSSVWHGHIGPVAVWDRALSAAEVSSLSAV